MLVTAAALGILGVGIGILGEPTFLIAGCLLVGAALIAAAVASLNQNSD